MPCPPCSHACCVYLASAAALILLTASSLLATRLPFTWPQLLGHT